MAPKRSRRCYFNIKQNRFQSKTNQKRWRGSLHSFQRINQPWRPQNHNYICINTRAPIFINTILKDFKTHINPSTLVGDFNTPLTPLDRSRRRNKREKSELNNTVHQIRPNISTEYSTKTPKNIFSTQHPMEHSLKSTIYWDTEQTSANTKKNSIHLIRSQCN